MATKKQKAAAKRQRTKAVQRMKAAATPKAKARAKAQVKALATIMKAKTTAKPTSSGNVKHALAKVRRTSQADARAAAVQKMKDLKPNSPAWKRAREKVIAASARVRKEGNIMRDITGRQMGEGTRYTGPTSGATIEAIRAWEAKNPEAAKLAERTKWQDENIKWMNELGGREAWRAAWGEPGSQKYKDMQAEQARRMAAGDTGDTADTGGDVVTITDGPGITGPGAVGAGFGFGGGGFDPNALSQYGGGYNQFSESVYPYAIPARDFIWQTDPTEQGLLASAMGRDDIAKLMLTGQYGPLAGQKYQYYGGRTGVNYGPTGGYGAGGVPLGQGGVPGSPGAGGNIGVGTGAGAGAGAGPVIPAAGGGGGLSLGGLGGLSLGGLGRPTMGGGRVQGGNVQSVADINAQEVLRDGPNIDQFAVNQMALPSLLSGRAALPSASWTAPANPYGVQPGGYTTGAVADFRNLVANTPMGAANQGVDFATLPPAPTVPLPPQLNATVPSPATTYSPFGSGVNTYGVGTYNPVTGTGGF